MNEIELCFLSGNHLGATAKLSLGSYTIGNTNDCDIYLASDRDDNIIQINVKEDAVTLSCVQGSALYAGQPLGKEEVEFVSTKVLNINLNCLAWFKQGESIESINPSDLGFKTVEVTHSKLDDNQQDQIASMTQEDADKTSKQDEGSSESIGAEQSEKDLNTSLNSSQSPDTQSINEQEESMETLKRINNGVQWLKLLSGVCILGFILCLLILGNAWFSNKDPILEAVNQAQDYVKKQELLGVNVQTQNGLLMYSGIIPDHATYADFIKNLPRTELSTVIEVKIMDDALTSIERAFALQEVTVQAQLSNKPNVVQIYGYIQDPFLAKQTLDKVHPYLGDFELEPHFTYATDMQEILFKLNSSANLPIKFSCDQFKVMYSGQMNLNQAKDFDSLYQSLTQEVHAPVVLENTHKDIEESIVSMSQQKDSIVKQQIMTTKEETAKPEANITSLSSSLPNSEIFDPSAIKGVTLNPMRFLTLQDGSKYFEGTALKNGYVLKNISLDKLLFEKNGHIVEINLR